MSQKKTTIKIVDKGKPNIGFLPLSIGKKVLRRMAAMQEAEKLKEEAKNLFAGYENKIDKSKKETKEIIDSAKKESEKAII